MRVLIACAVALCALACGGSQSPASSPDDDDTIPSAGQVSPEPTSETDPFADPMDPDAGVPEEVEPPMPVTFRIVNAGTDDLTFSIDKGWQPVIFGLAGKTPLVMFPRACMTTCDAAEEEICPYCPTPEKPKEEAAAEQRVVVPPGESMDKGWSLRALTFEKTKGLSPEGDSVSCLCYTEDEPTPAEYTVKACGFRVTDEANKPSKLQCVETKLTLPLATSDEAMDPADAESYVVELVFPDPPKRKRRRR